MKKLNKKGFTLVELLAVIVVLAFVMVLAAPSVLSSMNSARQSSFMLYAEKMLNAAQSRYQADQLIQIMDDTYCYNLKGLSDSKSTQYSGFVIVTKGTKQDAEYRIQMFDKTYTLGLSGQARGTNGEITDPIGDSNDGVTFNEVELIKTKLVGKTTLKSHDDFFTGGVTELESPCEKMTPKKDTLGAKKVSSTGEDITSANS